MDALTMKIQDLANDTRKSIDNRKVKRVIEKALSKGRTKMRECKW